MAERSDTPERHTRTIRIDGLARVEGHGSVHVRVDRGRVVEAQLRLFESPRLFEALLRGRQFTEAPDITARICGICPVAYQMSACRAMEDACGAVLEEPVQELRRLLYCGEWIESHALHIHLLHAPDFLGFEDGIAMARRYPEAVRRGLELKKIGNQIVTVLGGREIHPVNVRVGGFYRLPDPGALADLRERLLWARDAALETVRWVAGFDAPESRLDCELVALRHPDRYPMYEGRPASAGGLDLDPSEFEAHVREEHLPYTNALQARLRGVSGPDQVDGPQRSGAYLTGPLARYALNREHLAPVAREAAREAGLGAVCRNPHRSIVVRGVEVLHACEEALRILESYTPPERPAVPVEPVDAVGFGCTEAPRGLLYHRYAIGSDGAIQEARIIPPTSQNQRVIEEDLRATVERSLALPRTDLEHACERVVRSYDPCISCATHFLRLEIDEP
jgi:coenzyme F420-reducing hydrogenase alpha subunit